MRVTIASLVSASLLLGRASATLPPIIMKGSKFFYENGTQFFIKGVAYQQDSAAAGASTGSSKYTDPLADAASCKRDVPYLQGLNTNVIRTYAIDPTKNHDECMALLDAAGIYVISDLSEPSLSINRIDAQWDTELYQRYTSVVDNLSKYSNVIGFFAGNEVTNDNTTTQASAFVKAAVRDTKAYIKAHVKRWMGVGYAANDDSDIRANIAHYFNCGDPSDAIDFWGYNIYEWCGENTIQGSGYQDQIDFFKNYSVPVFFAEYGCNKNGGAAGRIFEETTALYSDQMTGDISGGIVYMYFQETNDFGLVSVSGDSVSTLKDYGALKTRIASVNPSATAMTAYNPTNSPAACPPVAPDWQVKGEVLPPTPDASLCECMFSSLSCVPAANLPTKNYTDIFGYICGASPASCVGQSANATTGLYGTYSMCNSTQKLGYVLDQYYKNTKYASDSCNFDGQAVLAKASGAASSCTAALSSASSANAAVATATGGTSSGSSGASSSSNAAVATGPVRHLFAMGEMAVGLYVFVAMAVGATMVLL